MSDDVIFLLFLLALFIGFCVSTEPRRSTHPHTRPPGPNPWGRRKSTDPEEGE